MKHVADLKRRIKKARTEGYKHVIAAGQSYGGAISLEAASESGLVDAVIAAAPGHGSDACGSGLGGARIANTLTDDLIGTIADVKSPRIVLTMADGDECMGFNKPMKPLRAALDKNGARFIFLDSTMPIRGHLAARTNQSDEWYQVCLLNFVYPDSTPEAKETKCATPNPVPRYLTPYGFELPGRPADKPDSLIGGWGGEYELNNSHTRNICVVVTAEREHTTQAHSLWGAGSQNKLSMSGSNRDFVKYDDRIFEYERGKYRMKLSRTDSPDTLALDIVTTSGREFEATLKRGCRLHH